MTTEIVYIVEEYLPDSFETVIMAVFAQHDDAAQYVENRIENSAYKRQFYIDEWEVR